MSKIHHSPLFLAICAFSRAINVFEEDNTASLELFQQVTKAWNRVQRIDKECATALYAEVKACRAAMASNGLPPKQPPVTEGVSDEEWRWIQLCSQYIRDLDAEPERAPYLVPLWHEILDKIEQQYPHTARHYRGICETYERLFHAPVQSFVEVLD